VFALRHAQGERKYARILAASPFVVSLSNHERHTNNLWTPVEIPPGPVYTV